MAKQTSLITFTGRLGNLIGYSRKGKYFLRSKPEVVRQTPATRRAAKRFGKASKRAALIRQACVQELDIMPDGQHVNRLTSMLLRTGMHHISKLAGFRFHQHTGINRFFASMPVLSADNTVHIPAQVLPVHKHMSALEVKIIATRIDFITQQVTSTDVACMVIDLHVPFTGAAMTMYAPGQGCLVMTLQVRCLSGDVPSANAQYIAADIIAVQLPAVQPSADSAICYVYPRAYRYTRYSSACAYDTTATGFIQRE
ncbi:hypothetical protein [Chitinophaga rhizophila]|uniref:Uncharacterized protein n=1 Tax=Chitinophaga rhizophila TaxID=2866212 RepID=A0ABS7GAT0_9BACT|nr:hypothetical protein [Chitinophaga rhizophila]MBW8684436.1 hypothetical protein [Chitinophaga rhizophila]